MLVAACLGLCHGVGHAQTWSAFGQVSPTLGNNQGRLCVGDTNADFGCPTYAPSLTTAGHVSVTGNLSAASFIGDGSRLTGLSAANVSVTTGASGSIVYRDAFGSLAASSGFNISSTTGSIGIGAGAPGWMTNGLYASGTIYGGNGMAVATAMSYGFGTSTVKMTGDSNAGTNYLAFTTSGTEAMRIVSTGYVGIGSGTPGARLHVYGNTGGDPSLRLQNTDTVDGRATVLFTTAYGGGQNFEVGIGTGGGHKDWRIRDTTSAGSPTRFAITTSGLVGIGTSGPGASLHVSGTARFDSNTEVRGTVSATLLRLADSPSDVCNSSNYGAIKVVNGSLYTCRQ